MSARNIAGGHSIPAALASVRARVSEAVKKYSIDFPDCGATAPASQEPRVVAISKAKPAEMVLSAYELGQRHFGENYVHELVEKSQHPLLSGLEDIRWHFVGHLQRNKCNSLTAVAHLWAVETVDSQRLAMALDNSWRKRRCDRKLRVFVQVNTSGEESKHGCSQAEAPSLVRYIRENCSTLEFTGLMTIGQNGHDYSRGPNPDFERLLEAQREVCREVELSSREGELSMGMSADFEQAILAGSTNVRVGSTIFGARTPT